MKVEDCAGLQVSSLLTPAWPACVDDFIQRLHAACGNVGSGLLPQFVQASGSDVIVNLLVPGLVEITLQPACNFPGASSTGSVCNAFSISTTVLMMRI
jgi:hypothetical protein